MIPWMHLGTGQIPGSADTLRLFQRDSEFSIRTHNAELMNSRLSGSEEALATLAAERLGKRPRPKILIGGLGMGFTLRAALGVLPVQAEIVVAELVPAIVTWARGPMAALFGESLTDSRVKIIEGDVGALIRDRAGWDSVLLDVDNGPEGMTHAGNDRLYAATGLTRTFKALTPGGVLAVWSARSDAGFVKRLRGAGFAVEEVGVRAHRGRRGAMHTIWLATRRG